MVDSLRTTAHERVGGDHELARQQVGRELRPDQLGLEHPQAAG